MPLLDVRNLSVDFKTANGQFRAVDGVDVQVDVGDVLAIVGESGSGKSVSMLALMGLLPWTATITSDSMMFDGVDLSRADDRKRRHMQYGVIPQLVGLDVQSQSVFHRGVSAARGVESSFAAVTSGAPEARHRVAGTGGITRA